MLQFLGSILYKLIPARFLKWKTGDINVDKHNLYCEKLAVVLIILAMYSTIIYLFVYKSWTLCTNIIDLINNKAYKKYKTTLFHRDNDFCNTMDGFLIVYIFFLLLTLFLNILFGVIYHYYRKYKDSKLVKINDVYNHNVIIHIPLYNEDYDTIKSTIDSTSNMNYKKENILLLIVADGIIDNSSNGTSTTDYTLLMEVLGNDEYKQDYETGSITNNTILFKDNSLKIYNGVYNGVDYSVILKCGNAGETIRRGNRGKKDSALIIYETIYHASNMESTGVVLDNCYTHIINKLNLGMSNGKNFQSFEYMLIVDCDTDADENSLIQLLNYLYSNENCIAVCGQTVVKNHSENYITMVQSFEYFISHLLLKTFESVMYNVLVLSGCFTLFKLKIDGKPTINMNILDKYTMEAKGLYKKNLLDLGEDRYLTVLIIQEYPDKHLAYISEATSLTNVPNGFNMLMNQRRRWSNSLIVCLALLGLSPPKQSMWKHIKMYLIIIMELFIIFLLPIVIVVGFLNSVVSIAVQGYSLLPVLITVFIILLNQIIALLVCNFKMMVRFIPFFTYLPIFSIYIPLYSIVNLDNLKWGITRNNVSNNSENTRNLEIVVETPREEITTLSYENMN